MNVVVNGEPLIVDADTTVGELVDRLGNGRSGIAVAVDGEVVPRTTWDERTINAGEVLDVLTAAQGG
jgi:sulfur carrier protein